MPDKPIQSIEPEAFAPASSNARSSEQNSASPSDSRGSEKPAKKPLSALLGVWLIPAILVLIALGLVVAPSLFNDSAELPVERSEQLADAAEVFNVSPEETPWADSQLLKARREAQELLAELLGVQERLESARVEFWAADEFEAVKSLAATGDQYYQDRQFDLSLQSYTEALDSALRLDATTADVALDFQKQGESLLQQDQFEQALETLQIANQLLPESETILSLLQQAGVREQILQLIDNSQSAARNENELESAKQYLLDAQALDSAYSPILGLIEDIDGQILQRNFRNAMSAGFAALSASSYDQASNSFKRAAQLIPENTAPREALQQVEAAKLNSLRQASLDRAVRQESSEDWQAALATYSGLLEEDASLTAARLGKLRAQTRFGLDTRIENIIADPLSLQSESKWQSANQTLSDARGIITKGPKLESQIETLERLVRVARTPVVLKLQSDNQTEIEIYRIGKIGTFAEHAMNLNPGKYVIVGRRNGYQDVRIDLAIDGSDSELIVPVICSVAI